MRQVPGANRGRRESQNSSAHMRPRREPAKRYAWACLRVKGSARKVVSSFIVRVDRLEHNRRGLFVRLLKGSVHIAESPGQRQPSFGSGNEVTKDRHSLPFRPRGNYNSALIKQQQKAVRF